MSILTCHTRPLVGCILLFLASIVNVSQAQVFPADIVRGVVGEELAIPILVGEGVMTGDTVILQGSFKLGDATVFFPFRFDAPERDTIPEWDIITLTDSTYTFTVTIHRSDVPNNEENDTLCYLAGEALAGADSICSLQFTNLLIDGQSVNDATGTIITESIGTPFPYVRFATLEPGYPNPIFPGTEVTWGYRIDKTSDVTFIIYNDIGEEMVHDDLGMIEHGVHLYRYTPGKEFASGVYFIRMKTNSGEASETLHILR